MNIHVLVLVPSQNKLYLCSYRVEQLPILLLYTQNFEKFSEGQVIKKK